MHAFRRHLGSVLIISVTAALAGCTTSPTPEATRAIEPAEPSPSPTSVERPDVPAPPEQLTFEAGADLDPEVWLAGWHAEPIDMTHGYPVVYPRDDWEEMNLSDGCEGSRYHRFGSLDGLDLTLDDRTLSDQYLAQILEMPVAEVYGWRFGCLVPGGRAVAGDGGLPGARRRLERRGQLAGSGEGLRCARHSTGHPAQLRPRSDDRGDRPADVRLLPEVVGLDGLDVGLGRVDWNIVETLTFDDGADLVASSERTVG